MDNHYGAGVPSKSGRQFWQTVGCPLHLEVIPETV